MDSEEITRLVARAQQGDHEAFDALVYIFHPEAFRLAISLLDDYQEAQDAVQETFFRVFQGLGSFRGDSSFRTWLYSISLNVCRGRLRKEQRNQRLMSVLKSIVWSQKSIPSLPEMQVLSNERKSSLMRSVSVLPEDQRTTLILRYYHEMTIAEIADLMGVVERTVYVRIRKAFERLQEDLGDIQD